VQAPVFKEIWFNNRLYHKVLVEEKGQQFVVSPTPTIKMEIEGTTGFGVKTDSVSIVLDEGKADAKTFTMGSNNVLKATSVGTLVSALDVEFTISGENKLSEGDHTFTFSAFDATGSTKTTEVCTVSVMGGPARIIGEVIVYPAPFSPSKDNNCEISYTLSTDTDLRISIYSIAGEMVKRIHAYAGQEGGSAGYNKVMWDGKNTYGQFAGNGIYSGTVYDVAQGKALATFKLTIVH
jgi:flagellar hook assembly protein FlgD